eukprot:PRCOL_00001500-RA
MAGAIAMVTLPARATARAAATQPRRLCARAAAAGVPRAGRTGMLESPEDGGDVDCGDAEAPSEGFATVCAEKKLDKCKHPKRTKDLCKNCPRRK